MNARLLRIVVLAGMLAVAPAGAQLCESRCLRMDESGHSGTHAPADPVPCHGDAPASGPAEQGLPGGDAGCDHTPDLAGELSVRVAKISDQNGGVAVITPASVEAVSPTVLSRVGLAPPRDRAATPRAMAPLRI